MSELCGSVPLCHMLETGPLVGGTSFRSELCGDVQLVLELLLGEVVLYYIELYIRTFKCSTLDPLR